MAGGFAALSSNLVGIQASWTSSEGELALAPELFTPPGSLEAAPYYASHWMVCVLCMQVTWEMGK